MTGSTAYDITVEVDPPYAADVEPAFLEDVARRVLLAENVAGPLEIGIWITNEDELRTLNRTYRGKDSTTDVLSFGQDTGDDPFVYGPEAGHHLGDVAISFPHAVRQAGEMGHSRERELAWLLAHGILHLLGHDHEVEAEAEEMRAREERALGDLGLARGSGNAGDAT